MLATYLGEAGETQWGTSMDGNPSHGHGRSVDDGKSTLIGRLLTHEDDL
ncbi:MAG: hypothetical protein R2704_04130 [Microthrixaceae bacterium]